MSLPEASDIASTLIDASDPLAFIQANIKKMQPAVASNTHEAAPATSIDPLEQELVENLPLEVPDPTPKQVDPPDEDDYNDDEDGAPPITAENAAEALLNGKKAPPTPEEHIRDLRKLRRELKSTIKTQDSALGELKAEVERYKTGEAVPEVVEQLQSEVNELSYYRNLHALRLSPEYEATHIQPIEQDKQKARELAAEYQIDPAVFDEASKIPGKRERNAYLSRHFDPAGTLEASNILDSIKNRHQKAQEAENEPLKALETLKEAHKAAHMAQEEVRITSIKSNSRGAWIDALKELRDSGEYPELTLTGDPEQDRMIKPVLESAASEYGKMVALLGAEGTKNLPKDAAKMIAKRFLLSQAAGITAASRNAYAEHAAEIETNTRRQSSMIRPAVGKAGSGMSYVAPTQKQPESPEEAAEVLLRKVGLA